MKTFASPRLFACFIAVFLISCSVLQAQKNGASGYHIYAGNTHAHTLFTQSHGAMYDNLPGAEKHMETDSNNTSVTLNTTLKPDWQKFQGPPSEHYAIAKASGYDFYVTTDHSQEATFHPTDAKNANWVATHVQAEQATDKNFVAIAGHEHSENNGPGGKGHYNVMNSASYLNALEPGVDIPRFYQWLDTVASYNHQGPVVVSFNHPGPKQYDNWAYRDPKVTDIITMLEVINSNKNIHYAAFISALDAGWKVSPVCGNDNHGTVAIRQQTSRTFVIAKEKTKLAILDAMKNRRTYASLDKNLQCIYTVNGEIMGSTLNNPGSFRFKININNPDTDDAKNKITKIDIVKDSGIVVQTYTPTPGYKVEWTPTINDKTSKYFFIRVWTAGGGDAPGASADKPVAWLAPVWTGRN